ncbi:hypothetical protein LOK49_Contig37G00005 [Camellia lanceoleosa]|nr:hypothetical protein LOK49_Contig37G00005 [Camellia lanceoleosa]
MLCKKIEKRTPKANQYYRNSEFLQLEFLKAEIALEVRAEAATGVPGMPEGRRACGDGRGLQQWVVHGGGVPCSGSGYRR